MAQYAKYWAKVTLPLDDLPLFPHYYVPASPLGSASPAQALVRAPLQWQGPPARPPPVKNPPASLAPGLQTAAAPTAASAAAQAEPLYGGLDRHLAVAFPSAVPGAQSKDGAVASAEQPVTAGA